MSTEIGLEKENHSISASDQYLECCEEYTHSYEREKLELDWKQKDRVAKKIVGDFVRRAGDPAKKTMLDIGFGNGAFVVAFAQHGARVSGLEVNQVLYDIACAKMQEKQYTADLRLYDGMHFPFENESFDYMFSTSVLEHVDSPQQILSEVSRTLKPGGRLYLSFPNRIALRETHTGILFLSYLPRAWAEYVLQYVFKRNTISELNLHFIGYRALVRALRGTSLVIVPEYQATSRFRYMIKRVLGMFGIHYSAILKTIMVIIEKPV